MTRFEMAQANTIGRRTKSWSGILVQAPGLGSIQKPLPRVKRQRSNRPGLKQAVIKLPPLKHLPPPISLTAPLNGIDLNVDFETEVKPFLGPCLVSLPYTLCQRWLK